MSQIINFTRLTTSDRLSDRFLTCQVYQPFEEELKDKGIILSQVEILNPWFSISQVGQTLINTLIREYYKSEDTSDLNNFEDSIKSVNESLAQIAQTGETDWIGKLSSVLVLVIGKEVHFAQTGQSHAYLYRSGKINHITEGLDTDSSPHPLKTFTNLTSGTLQEDDKIIIANSSFFENISPDELTNIITENHPTKTAIETAKVFKNRGVNNANAIILELTTKEKLANLPPDEKIETIYINEQLTSLTTNLKSIWRNLIVPLGILIQNNISLFYKRTKKELSPAIKKGASSAKAKSETVFKKAIDSAKTGKDKLQTKVGQKLPKVSSDKSTLENIKTRLTLFIIRAKNRIRRFLIQAGVSKAHGPRIYLYAVIATAIILTITIGITSYQKSRVANLRSLDEKLSQIVALKGEAADLESKNLDKQALEKYKVINKISEDLSQTKYDQEAKVSKKEALEKILSLSNATEKSPEINLELPEEHQTLTLINGNIFSIAKNSVYQLEGDKFIENIKLKESVDSISTTSLEGSIVFLAKQNKLAKISEDGLVSYPQSNLSGSKIIEYIGNLYILDQTSNQIWKITETNELNDKSAYIKDEDIVLADTPSFAIDGSIYTVNTNCKVSRFSRGSILSDFIPTLPAEEVIENCTDIFTAEDYENILLLSKASPFQRAIITNKNGQFSQQFFLMESNDYSQAIFDTTNSKLYLTKENRILSYNLD